MFRIRLLVALSVLLGSVVICSTQAHEGETSSGGQLFEQRVYTCAPGMLDDLNARFRDHTNYLFVKHGIKLIGYWTPVDQPDTLVYILAYANREARDASWKAFMADPEWQRVWAESKKKAGDKSLVTKVESTFMTPTDYSPLQ